MASAGGALDRRLGNHSRCYFSWRLGWLPISLYRRAPKKDPMSTRHAWLATSMVFIGALVFAIARAGYLRTTDTGFRILISSGIAILCGTFLLALWSGRRLAVQVEVRTEQEEANTSATAYLAARLAGLGGGRPEGLLRLKGTDVTALPADAIGELPPGRFAQALIKLTLALVPVVPWRIVATEGPGGVVTVDIRRNYRSVELILICRVISVHQTTIEKHAVKPC